MRFPASLYTSLAAYFMGNSLKGIKKFPLVLMLEPTHRCNLACAGCDRIRLYESNHTEDLTLSECTAAVMESNAPVVTITGGEPLLYKELTPLVEELIKLKRHVYLCSNGILTKSFIEESKPHTKLTLNFHLDGMEESHDQITNKSGTWKSAIESIKMAKQKGFRVTTNTSVYKKTDVGELKRLFEFLTSLGIDGILVSPAFSYERVEGDVFLSKDEAIKKFQQMDFFDRFPFISSPLYIDFLKGLRYLHCTPWGNPTRNPLGWKSPCYLITDAYYSSFRELMEKTPWDKYERGIDRRCKDCMVHSGYEATVQRMAFSHPKDLLRLALWNLKKT
jgi:hopanoid biosynthesis associated radical SAM protein HpnH